MQTTDDRGILHLPSAHIGSESGSPEERFIQWTTSITPYFSSAPLADPRNPPQPTTASQYHLTNFLFLDSQFSRQMFVRTPNWARQNDDTDHVLLQTFVKGHNDIVASSKNFRADDSTVFAVNMIHNIEAACQDADVVTLILPRQWIGQYIPSLPDANGQIFQPGGMAARLFRDYMITMRQQIPHASVGDVRLLTDSMLGFLSPLIETGDPLAAGAERGVFQTMAAFVDANLDDVNLGVHPLCAHFRVSRATLFRLFKSQGGVESFIRHRRLMACFKGLSDPGQLHRKVIDIGMDFGFHNPSHLSTLFKQYFGMTPREVREVTRTACAWVAPSIPASPEQRSDVELMQEWARSLGRSSK